MDNTNKNIYTKLLDFQKKEIVVKRVGENPHFRSSYVTLNEVLEKVKKPLSDLGILILQVPQADGLRTILYDTETSSSIEAFMPYVEATTAQKLGSNNTYNRRYSLVTLLGLEDEDDDGNISSSVSSQNAPGSTKVSSTSSASQKQKDFIRKLINEQNKPMPDDEWFEKLTMPLAKASIEKLLGNQGGFREELPTVTQE